MYLNFCLYILLLYVYVIMSNLTKLKINALDITRNNYKTWTVGAKMNLHLRENELWKIIDKLKTISDEKKKSHDIYTNSMMVYKMRCIMRKDLEDLW